MSQTKTVSIVMVSHAIAVLSIGFISGCASKNYQMVAPQPRIRDDFANYATKTYVTQPRRHMYEPDYQVSVTPEPSTNTVKPSNGSYVYHTVKKGETLYAISRKYGKNVHDIAHVNNLNNGNYIKVGQKLRIPATSSSSVLVKREKTAPVRRIAKRVTRPNYKPLPASMVKQTTTYAIHTVKRGDNISRVADKYDVTVDAICSANGLDRNVDLDIGQKIKIPVN